MSDPVPDTRDRPPRAWSFGEALAALVYRDHGPAELSDTLHVGVGGAELNVAIGLARLGHSSAWAGVVGDDPWGRRIRRELAAEGVDAYIRVNPAAPTGAYVREHRTLDLVRVSYLRAGSAGSTLSTEDIMKIVAEPGDVVHITGLTPVLSDSAAVAWGSAAAQAHADGATVSYDINFRSRFATTHGATVAFETVAPHIHTVMASVEEAEIVTGRRFSHAREAADALIQRLSPGTDVIIKTGADGALHVGGDGVVTVSRAVQVAVSDLVGAGDAFAAGYLSGVLDGLSVPERLERGHICAAFVVSTPGDWEGAPRRHELSLAPRLTAKEVHR